MAGMISRSQGLGKIERKGTSEQGTDAKGN